MEVVRQDGIAVEMALHTAISSVSGIEQANVIRHPGLRSRDIRRDIVVSPEVRFLRRCCSPEMAGSGTLI
jgi:hypothetical protein